MTEEDRLRWDARHAAREESLSVPPGPPALLAPFEHLVPTAGHALELACGRGEASVWLARLGLDVEAYDVSPVAVGAARDLARRNGVAGRCRFHVVDLDDGLPEGPPADVVLCHMFRDARLDQALVQRLAPGGLVAIATLSEVDVGPGPYRARRGELCEAFASLELLAAGEGDGRAWLIAPRRR